MLDSKSGDLSRVLKEGLKEKNGPALKEFSCKILQTAKATQLGFGTLNKKEDMEEQWDARLGSEGPDHKNFVVRVLNLVQGVENH